jgi:hypothetical protein
MPTFLLELGAAFGVDQARRGIGEFAGGIAMRGQPLRLNEDRPAGTEPAQRIVET